MSEGALHKRKEKHCFIITWTCAQFPTLPPASQHGTEVKLNQMPEFILTWKGLCLLSSSTYHPLSYMIWKKKGKSQIECIALTIVNPLVHTHYCISVTIFDPSDYLFLLLKLGEFLFLYTCSLISPYWHNINGSTDFSSEEETSLVMRHEGEGPHK